MTLQDRAKKAFDALKEQGVFFPGLQNPDSCTSEELEQHVIKAEKQIELEQKLKVFLSRVRQEVIRASLLWPAMSSDADGRETIREEFDEFIEESRRSHKRPENYENELTELVQSCAMHARYALDRRGDLLK